MTLGQSILVIKTTVYNSQIKQQKQEHGDAMV